MNKCARNECDVLTANPKYCSRSCAVTENNRKNGARNGVPYVLKQCVFCSETFKGHPSRIYCSQKCMGAAKTFEKVDSWKKGTWDGSSSSGLATPIRNYLLEQANYTCQSPNCCVPGGWSVKNPVTGRVPLEVDHVDGDCYNNTEGNLIVLCPNCHSITPTYRALNKNGKRQYRRDRYAAGKSF